LELRQVLAPIEFHGPGWTLALFGNDDLGDVRRLTRFVVHLVPIDECNDVTVLFNRAGVSQIAQDGSFIRALLNGKACIEMEDDRIAGAGAVGVWTKADSVTLFDDFSYGTLTGR